MVDAYNILATINNSPLMSKQQAQSLPQEEDLLEFAVEIDSTSTPESKVEVISAAEMRSEPSSGLCEEAESMLVEDEAGEDVQTPIFAQLEKEMKKEKGEQCEEFESFFQSSPSTSENRVNNTSQNKEKKEKGKVREEKKARFIDLTCVASNFSPPQRETKKRKREEQGEPEGGGGEDDIENRPTQRRKEDHYHPHHRNRHHHYPPPLPEQVKKESKKRRNERKEKYMHLYKEEKKSISIDDFE